MEKTPLDFFSDNPAESVSGVTPDGQRHIKSLVGGIVRPEARKRDFRPEDSSKIPFQPLSKFTLQSGVVVHAAQGVEGEV
jgi:hypothetical protein